MCDDKDWYFRQLIWFIKKLEPIRIGRKRDPQAEALKRGDRPGRNLLGTESRESGGRFVEWRATT